MRLVALLLLALLAPLRASAETLVLVAFPETDEETLSTAGIVQDRLVDAFRRGGMPRGGRLSTSKATVRNLAAARDRGSPNAIVSARVSFDAQGDEYACEVVVASPDEGAEPLGKVSVQGANHKLLLAALANAAENLARDVWPKLRSVAPAKAVAAAARPSTIAPTVTRAPGSRGTLAVFDFRLGQDLAPDAGASVYAALQKTLIDALTPLGFTVLSSEQTKQQIAGNIDDPATLQAAVEQGNLLEIAKEINVAAFSWGSVELDAEADEVVGAINVQSVNGSMYGTLPLRARNEKKLLDAYRDATPGFVRGIREAMDPELRTLREAAEQAAAKAELDAQQARDAAERERKATQKAEDLRRSDDAKYKLPQNNPIFDGGGRFALRAGLGGLTGVLGCGVEYHLDNWAFAIGLGAYRSFGVVWYPLRDALRDGGVYASFSVDSTSGPLGERSDGGPGLTFGYDYRPVRWISIKGGVGAAYSSAAHKTADPKYLLVDLNAGLVF